MRLRSLGLLTTVCLVTSPVLGGDPVPYDAVPHDASPYGHGHAGVGLGRGDWVPQDITPIPTYKQQRFPTPHGSYVTTQGSCHHFYPRRRGCVCQVPASLCSKPKIWKFSQFWYQLHHEFWHGVTDPCWLMDPDCCGHACHHQKSFGALDLIPGGRQRFCRKAAAARRGHCHHDGCHHAAAPKRDPHVVENPLRPISAKPQATPESRGVLSRLSKLFQRK